MSLKTQHKARILATAFAFSALSICAMPVFAAGAGGSDTDVSTGTRNGEKAVRADTWQSENVYWEKTYASRPYYKETVTYTTVAPAYRYGVTAYERYHGQPYTELSQEELRSGWEAARDNSTISWEEAQPAFQDAYTHVHETYTTTTTLQ